MLPWDDFRHQYHKKYSNRRPVRGAELPERLRSNQMGPSNHPELGTRVASPWSRDRHLGPGLHLRSEASPSPCFSLEKHIPTQPPQDFYYNKRPYRPTTELISRWKIIPPRHRVHCSYCIVLIFQALVEHSAPPNFGILQTAKGIHTYTKAEHSAHKPHLPSY